MHAHQGDSPIARAPPACVSGMPTGSHNQSRRPRLPRAHAHTHTRERERERERELAHIRGRSIRSANGPTSTTSGEASDVQGSGVDHLRHVAAQGEARLLALGEVAKVADLAISEEGLPALLVLAAVVVFLEEGDRVAVEWERDVLLLLLLNLAMLDELVAPLLVCSARGGGEREDARLRSDSAGCTRVPRCLSSGLCVLGRVSAYRDTIRSGGRKHARRARRGSCQ